MKKKRRIFILGFLAVGLCSGCSVVAHKIYSQQFGRVKEFSERGFHTYIMWDEIDQTKYPREEVRFHSGKNQLQGYIYGRENDKGLVVFSHGLGGTADGYFPMIMYFVDQGWRVFAFSNTGVSGSEGIDMRGLPQSAIDLDAALVYVSNSTTLGHLPLMLVGHSWGGFAVCAVLNYAHHVNAVVSFAAFNNGSKMFKEQGVAIAGLFYHLLSPQFWAIERVRFGSKMKLNAVDGINKANIPVMIVHCSTDKLISDKTTSIYAHRDAITNPKVEIVYLQGENAAGHEFVFGSKEMRAYRKAANENLQNYLTENSDASPIEWAKEFGFDKFKANELNGELMERINTFFNDAID